MKLLAGLGNPGTKYARNRHNVGFMVLDRIAGDHGFGPWKGKFRGLVSEGRLNGEKVILLKPQTFMNRSGESVGEAMRFFKLTPAEVVVFHDELDLAPGKVRVKTGGGHAGHNGLRSIHAHIGPDYTRVRIGIGHPGRKELVTGYVLHDFSRVDEGWLEAVLRGVSDGVPHLAAHDPARFLNAVALRTSPPRSSGGDGGEAARRRSNEKGSPPAGTAGKRAIPDGPVPDTRTALQKLVDRFR